MGGSFNTFFNEITFHFHRLQKKIRYQLFEADNVLKLLEPGTLLRDRYRILASVGQGGMGAVYRAEDLRLEGRLCAIKEVRPDFRADDASLRQAQAQFHREASILARLDHPNLPKANSLGRYRQVPNPDRHLPSKKHLTTKNSPGIAAGGSALSGRSTERFL